MLLESILVKLESLFVVPSDLVIEAVVMSTL